MIIEAAKWFLSINKKIFSIAPGISILVTVLTLISQIAVIIAFLLPLKVILMMASDSIPGYFPTFMQAYDRDELIIWLGTIAIVLYFLYLALTAIIERLNNRGVAVAVSKSAKLFLRSDQTKTMQNAYKQVTKIQADILFVLICVPVIAVVYPYLATFLLIGLLLLSCGLLWGTGFPSFHAALKSVGTQILFLFAFVFMVVDFLHGGIPDRYAALVSVILARQVLSRFGAGANAFSNLLPQRPLIDAAYFHGIAYEPKRANDDLSFWETDISKKSPDADAIVLEAFHDYKGIVPKNNSISLVNQVGTFGLFTSSENYTSNWLLKIYEPRRLSAWTRENEFLQAIGNSENINVPMLTSTGNFRSGKTILLALSGSAKPTILERSNNDLRIQLLENLWNIAVPPNLLAKYQRSHPFKYQMLKGDGMEKLHFLCVLSKQTKEFETFLKNQTKFQAVLGKLPLVFINPKMNAALVNCGSQITCVDWSEWSIEPIGSSWNRRAWNRDKLDITISNLAKNRTDMRDVLGYDVELAAIIYDLATAIERNRWADALQLMLLVNQSIASKNIT